MQPGQQTKICAPSTVSSAKPRLLRVDFVQTTQISFQSGRSTVIFFMVDGWSDGPAAARGASARRNALAEQSEMIVSHRQAARRHVECPCSLEDSAFDRSSIEKSKTRGSVAGEFPHAAIELKNRVGDEGIEFWASRSDDLDTNFAFVQRRGTGGGRHFQLSTLVAQPRSRPASFGINSAFLPGTRFVRLETRVSPPPRPSGNRAVWPQRFF